MTKAELIDSITKQLPSHRKLARADVEAMLDALSCALGRELHKGARVPLPGVGMLEVKTRKARQGRNPRTGETITIPACKVVQLRVSSVLKDMLNCRCR